MARQKIHSNQSGQGPSPGSPRPIRKCSSSLMGRIHSLLLLFFLIVFILQSCHSSVLTDRHSDKEESAEYQPALTSLCTSAYRAHPHRCFYLCYLTKVWQWANMRNTRTLKLNGIQPSFIFTLIYTCASPAVACQNISERPLVLIRP